MAKQKKMSTNSMGFIFLSTQNVAVQFVVYVDSTDSKRQTASGRLLYTSSFRFAYLQTLPNVVAWMFLPVHQFSSESSASNKAYPVNLSALHILKKELN